MSPPTKFRAGALWSLWEIMNVFEAGNCTETFASLMQMAQVSSYGNGDTEIPQQGKDRIKLCLNHAALVADQVEAKRALEMILDKIDELDRKITNAEFLWFVHNMVPVLTAEMRERKFFVLTQDSEYYETALPFDPEIFDAFPTARYDAIEASNCFALERYSASVHHSMSALEPALKALATDVGAAVKDGMWKGVIDRIESKITDLKKTLPAGKERNERLQFLSAAAKEFFYFKDGWRNYIARAKAQYDREQALGAMNHAAAFMRHLSSRLSEDGSPSERLSRA